MGTNQLKRFAWHHGSFGLLIRFAGKLSHSRSVSLMFGHFLFCICCSFGISTPCKILQSLIYLPQYQKTDWLILNKLFTLNLSCECCQNDNFTLTLEYEKINKSLPLKPCLNLSNFFLQTKISKRTDKDGFSPVVFRSRLEQSTPVTE